MKPRPMYRWKSFWLGMFVACFLAWAWWDSMRFQTSLVMRGGMELGVMRHKGATYFVRGMRLFQGFWRTPAEDSMAPEIFEFLEGPNFRSVRVPDAMVSGAFMVVWCGWLTWRWMREEREDAP